MALTRRTLLQVAAVAGVGCARRIPEAPVVQGPSPSDGVVRVALDSVPQLRAHGGSVVLRVPRQGFDALVLVANAGAGFVALDAVCPHQGCTLAWVPEDREAECPCHLSRFSSDGLVLHPPATTDVSAYAVESDGTTVSIVLYPGDGRFPDLKDGKVTFALSSYPALADTGGVVVGWPRGLDGPIAVIRAATDRLTVKSARCTHLGCTVQPASCSTQAQCDTYARGLTPGAFLHCPCHGSNFTLSGQTLARADGSASLAPINLPHYPDATVSGDTVLLDLSAPPEL